MMSRLNGVARERLFLILACLLLSTCSPRQILQTRLATLSANAAPALATSTGRSPATSTSLPPATETRTPAPPAPTPETRTIRLMAVGDVMLARSIGQRILSRGPAVPFAGVQRVLDQADLLVANLECTISDRGTPQPKGYTFRAPLAAAETLRLAGVDVVSQANNHAFDYGVDAFRQTQQLLGVRKIGVVGAGENETAARTPFILERNGLRIALLGYVDVPVESRGFDTRRWIATANAPGVAWARLENIARDVAAARTRADLVVVMFHFGWEGRTTPIPAQRAEAHAAIDAGASLVLGAHPHVLQGVERYKNGLIVYSLGNFVFDGFSSVENYSAIFDATLTTRAVEEYHWTPIVVENGLPRLATGVEAPAILARVKPLP